MTVHNHQGRRTLVVMMTVRYVKIMRTFSRNLRKARAKRYASAELFAPTIGLQPHTYRRYERGEVEPNFEILIRICEALGCDANTLLPVENQKKMGNERAA